MIILLLNLFLSFSLAFSATVRPPENNLTKSFAVTRRAQVSSIDYDLYFRFTKGSERYQGKTTLQLELKKLSLPLSIDFSGEKIHAITVNNKPVKDFKLQKGSFLIPVGYLSANTTVTIEFENVFSQTGEGITRTIDPEDQAEYIATDFEPYQAHHLFPCLDQPDLKARYTLTVDAPSDWTIVSNDLIVKRTNQADMATSVFAQSKTFSTYLFFLAGGPWYEWQDDYLGMPLVLYARKSLKKYVDHEKIFDTTKKGLEFFSDYFGVPYPFPKYGQIFIPEFSWGGMENPGAVALNERHIYREAVSPSKIEGRDNLILHEMAHMWFGDLVTMEWWDDLWLNESFASYLASLAQDRALATKSAWPEFSSDKNWGYWQDQLVTTHPIETAVVDTRSARGNFDGITYAKGAASLKQLHFYIGEEAFKAGLQTYFKEFSFKNATRADFINHLENSSKMKLAPWVKAWLQSKGPNKVKVEWSCQGEKLNAMTIHQKPSVSGVYSPHRTRIGLYKRDGQGKYQLIQSQDVTYSSAKTNVSSLLNSQCPDFVFPNLDDQDYALFSLDAQSQKHAQNILRMGSDDPLLRMQLWSILGQMVRDAELLPQHFVDIGLGALEVEQEDLLLGIILGKYGPLSSTHSNYLSKQERLELAPKFEKLVWDRMLAAKKGSGVQLNFFDFYISIVQSVEGQTRLFDMVKNDDAPGGIDLGPVRRWAIIKNLSALATPGIAGLLEQEEKKDNTTSGQRAAYAAKVAQPLLDNKNHYWEEFKHVEKIGHNKFEEGASHFHHPNFPELAQAFTLKFFEMAKTIPWQDNDMIVESYFGSLFPGNLCHEDLLKISKKSLGQAKNLTSLAKRSWLEANDELARCIRIMKNAQQAQK